MDKNEWLRIIPKVDVILDKPSMRALIEKYGKEPVADAIREELEKIRSIIMTCFEEDSLKQRMEEIETNVYNAVVEAKKSNLRRVINATGVILHTNLGRAPLPPKALDVLYEQMKGYMNLEYDLQEGRRGERYAHFEELLCKITGAEAAMAVNNNAAAALLMVSAIGAGKEVIVSRGEQIEIGGKFRIPDIIDQSGATRIEIGTTNKTRISDYENAITEQTGAFLKVHTSNFKMVGFSESVQREELVELGRKYQIPVIEDLGSGVFINLSHYGLSKEPTVQDSIKAGVDIVCFSGDKLLGGPQAGILVGKKEWIERCKKHPFTRAMRIDKCTAAMLEAIFAMYEDEDYAIKHIPVLNMLTTPVEQLEDKANRLVSLIGDDLKTQAEIAMIHCMNPIGGGSLPGEELESVAISIFSSRIAAADMLERLRSLTLPVIGRIEDNKLLLDMRTMTEEEIPLVAEIITKEYKKWSI